MYGHKGKYLQGTLILYQFCKPRVVGSLLEPLGLPSQGLVARFTVHEFYPMKQDLNPIIQLQLCSYRLLQEIHTIIALMGIFC